MFLQISSIDIKLRNSTMKVKNDFTVLVNGVEHEKPIRMHNIKIGQLTQFGVEIELFGVLVTWVPMEENIEIIIEPIFSDRTLGLCGTFNWNQKVKLQ